MKRRVVITGMGAVTPLGNSLEETWQGVREGRCGIGPITAWDASGMKVQLAAEVRGLDVTAHIPKGEARKMARFTQLGLIAATEAFRQSGITPENTNLNRCGVMVSSGIGGLPVIEEEHGKGLQKGWDRISPHFIPMSITNMAAGTIAIRLGLRGMCSSVVSACASGSNAVGDAFRQIRDGYADAVVCGGTEAAITPLAVGGFTSMRALHEGTDPSRASIPFDKERSGFVMGEGAGVLVLEELHHAKNRGAQILGEVLGYGSTCDAYHITAPAPGGEGAVRCVAEALADAELSPREIGYINAHGTSTPLNDRTETQAIHAVFGENPPPVSSTKSMMGHLLGASGAVEAIVTVMALKEGFLPATINYREPDPECNLDPIPNQGRSTLVTAALSNSLGFGGHNATLVFGRYQEV
ncbi:MAG: beta-ketoacyl-ACP synthase II [Angelakisella sp.]|jgi:3-oxoacyl-[acyl-carrier-protein] synthase II|nr:beta-ketoacyl-ACP synthase II [Angelakisella sp.]